MCLQQALSRCLFIPLKYRLSQNTVVLAFPVLRLIVSLLPPWILFLVNGRQMNKERMNIKGEKLSGAGL